MSEDDLINESFDFKKVLGDELVNVPSQKHIWESRLVHEHAKSEMKPEPEPKEDIIAKKTGISNAVIEAWLNETLSHAEDLNIPGVMVEPAFK